MKPDVIATRAWRVHDLATRHPPRFIDRNKRAVHSAMGAPGAEHTQPVTVTRWAPVALPEARDPGSAELTVAPGWFDYRRRAADATAWWVNFADPDLFGYYAGPLLAQDELQCLEIPTLASVREAWLAEGLPARTVDHDHAPTPVTVHGAPRQGALSAHPTPKRPWGLYGNAFSCAPTPQVVDALAVLRPAQPVHVLAMAAPRGAGPYTPAALRQILHTATTAFAAARAATEAAGADPDEVEVHTGWWGCGAFGGDREVMALLQLEAADLAGLRHLVFHTGEPGSESPLAAARDVRSRLRDTHTLDGLVAALAERGYRWGRSNGT